MISNQLQALFIQAVKDGTGKEIETISFEEPKSSEFGDQATNIALMLSKELGKNPREVAQSIVDALPENDLIDRTDIAGPGFINFWFAEKVFEESFEELIERVESKSYGHLTRGNGKIAITDTSHPNIAKPMGVHHLLSTIIGQAINNLIEANGYERIRDNYLGDWGTQYGKLIVSIKKWGDIEKIKEDPITELLKLYVTFHDEAEKNPGLEDEGRAAFKKLEEGDEEFMELWKWIRQVSIDECEKIWKRLGVEFDSINGESFYEDKMEEIIKEGIEKGVIIEGNEGALIIEMDDENKPPAIIKKSDGATLYATRDLARIKYWQDELKGDLGINVVDVAQKLYFEQLFESAEKLGMNKMHHVHVEFGRMSFPEGGMSTRKGKIILLEDVLDEAEKRALEKIKEHNSKLPEEEQVELARKIGISAIKYNVLSQSRTKNYTFDWDIMLSFDGNSAPYLQYAYTRTQSVLRKASSLELQASSLKLQAPEELGLLKKLLAFEAQIERSLTEYKPNHLCNYLFELAQAFSLFYNNVRILDGSEEEQASRLKLVEAVAYVLKNGLEILGIEVPERM